MIAANHDTLWRRLATIMGQPELGEDERFATHHARGEHEDLLDEIIGEFAARHTADELDEIVNEGGVVCAPVYTAEDVYKDPHFRERELLVELEDEVHGQITVPGGRAQAEPDARLDPPGRPLDGGRRHGRSAGGARSGRGGAQAPRGRRRDLGKERHGVSARAWTSEGRSPTCSSSRTQTTGSGG